MSPNAFEILDNYCKAYDIACWVSPCHDKDIDDNGDIKKPHYHILLVAPLNDTIRFTTFKKIAELCNISQGSYIQSIIGAYSYLTHERNPEKYQYTADEIIRLGGAPSVTQLSLLQEDIKKDVYCDLVEFIIKEQITELHTLYSSEYFLLFGLCDTWAEYFNLLKSNHYYIRDLISSIRNSIYYKKEI